MPPQLVHQGQALNETDKEVAAAAIRAAHTRLSGDNNGNTIVIGAISAFVGAIIASAFGDGNLTDGPMTWAALALLLFFLMLVTATKPLRKQIANLNELAALWLSAPARCKTGLCPERWSQQKDRSQPRVSSWLESAALPIAGGALLISLASASLTGWTNALPFVVSLFGAFVFVLGSLAWGEGTPVWKRLRVGVWIVGAFFLAISVLLQPPWPAVAASVLVLMLGAIATLLDGRRSLSGIDLLAAAVYPLVCVIWPWRQQAIASMSEIKVSWIHLPALALAILGLYLIAYAIHRLALRFVIVRRGR